MKRNQVFAAFCLVSFWAGGSLRADAQQVKIAVPILSGLFDKTGDGRARAALDAIFNTCEMQPTYEVQRWGQHWQRFEEDKSYDAVAVVWDTAGVSGFPSVDFIRQQNGIVYLADKNLEIKSPTDLAGLNVMGFGGATDMFPGLAEALPTVKRYWEAPQGFAATQALVNGDADVFITDGLIFAIDYMWRIDQTGAAYGDEHWPEMTFSGIFPMNGDRMHFRSKALRDRFNACIAEARENGAIAAATKPYVDPYRHIVSDQIPAY